MASSESRYTVAHVLPFPSVGGTEHATLRIAGAVDPARFTNIAFATPDAEPVRALVSEAGLACFTYQPPEPSYRQGAGFLRSSVKLARAFQQQKIDLVHCADLLAGYQAALAGRIAGVPVLCHIRNRFDDISRRDRSFLWPVHTFLFVSEDTWRHFAYRVPRRRGRVVYDGLDVPPPRDAAEDGRSVRSEFGLPEDAPIVGMMARVAPQKDFATLARAAKRVMERHPSARFLIAGDYESPQNLDHFQRVRSDLEACGVADAFIFTGYRTDVPRLLQALDVFVLSTHWEGLPLVILEAMARGIPVIATAVDGVPEIVNDGETGLLFAHQDSVKLADHIERLLLDRAEARRLGDAGRRVVQTRFSRARFAEEMTAAYDSVLRHRRKAHQ